MTNDTTGNHSSSSEACSHVCLCNNVICAVYKQLLSFKRPVLFLSLCHMLLLLRSVQSIIWHQAGVAGLDPVPVIASTQCLQLNIHTDRIWLHFNAYHQSSG